MTARSTALVVLDPATGGTPRPEQLTAARLGEAAPDSESAAAVRSWFQQQGFDVGPLVGISFAIEGRSELFLRLLRLDADAQAGGTQDSVRLSLERTTLPRQLHATIAAVTFTRPPDFGPRNP